MSQEEVKNVRSHGFKKNKNGKKVIGPNDVMSTEMKRFLGTLSGKST